MKLFDRNGALARIAMSLTFWAAAVSTAGIGHVRAIAQEQDRPEAEVTVASDVLRIADQTKAIDADRSPLRFEMPRISAAPVAESLRNERAPGAGSQAAWPDNTKSWTNSVPSFVLMAGLTFLPAALLMTTAFVRIQITLGLLRQALGSPSIPGNQVIVALSLLLTVLVMKPVAQRVYEDAIAPCAMGQISQAEALRIGSGPIKKFMLAQIRHTGHEDYLDELAVYARSQDGDMEDHPVPESVAAVEPLTGDDAYPLHVVAPAFLLSELTTALSIGFAVYLPFLVVDLVVATILAAMGIWMMPPTLISTPAKLILFVLADGWMLTAGALINGFAAV